MKDPFFIPPIPALSEAVRPWAERYGMKALPLHVHEVLAAALFYTFIQVVVSPYISNRWFPQYYPKHSRGRKANWDSHVVSLVQSTLINILALWVMLTDEERKGMDWEQRIWGYTGSSGLRAELGGWLLRVGSRHHRGISGCIWAGAARACLERAGGVLVWIRKSMAFPPRPGLPRRGRFFISRQAPR